MQKTQKGDFLKKREKEKKKEKERGRERGGSNTCSEWEKQGIIRP